jgi:uncharacterized MAPEG superfamily protein
MPAIMSFLPLVRRQRARHSARHPSREPTMNISFSPSLLALLGYAAWALVLLCAIAALRSRLVMSRQRRANAFSPWGDDVSPFSGRLCRAHANCVENLPIFGALVMVAVAAGRADITDALAPWALAARVAQSALHLASLSNRAVTWRFGFMVVQLLILGWWIVRLLLAALFAGA